MAEKIKVFNFDKKNREQKQKKMKKAFHVIKKAFLSETENQRPKKSEKKHEKTY